MELSKWVNDELHSILGYSDSNVAQYMIALAKKSYDADDFLQRVVDTEPTLGQNTQQIHNFAKKLVDSVPHAGKYFKNFQ